MDREEWRTDAALRDLLGALMTNGDHKADVLDVVALLADRPAAGLARGQVGTIVELLDPNAALVEFSGDDGRAFAIESIPRAELLILHYVPEAAE